MTNFVNADFVFWEVEYANGTTLREGQDGLTYGGINRATLKKFKLVNTEGTVIFETWPPPGKNGHNFVYRRRTRIMENGQKMTLFVLGWLPDGPAFAIDVNSGEYRQSEVGFIVGDADLYPPDPMPGELWFLDNPGQGHKK